MKYNIAFLTYDWNTEIAGQFTTGIRKFVEDHPDVSIHLFSGFGSYRSNDTLSASLQIFNLPYLSSYDGIILQGNRVWSPEERNKLVRRAQAYGVPVVSINYPLDNTVIVGSDNYQASYDLTEHLIVKHHCKTLAVLAGLTSSKEAQDRKKGALDCAKKYGIKDVKVYANEWDEEYGAEAARAMIEKGEVPEGIVCGNDNLAFGAEAELLKQGYRIPEDVKVTGFDDLSVAAAAPVRITTVNRNFPRIAYTAMQTILDIAEGKKVPQEIHPKEDMIFSSSCGCGDKANEVSALKEKYLRANRYVYDYYKLHNGLSDMLDKARSLSDIAETMEVNADAFQSGSLYVVLNGLYLENFGNTNPIRHYGNNMVLVGMSDSSGMRCDEKHVYATFSREVLLPEEILARKHMLQVYSLQSEETCIGYVVTDGFENIVEFNFLETAFSLLDNAIERVRRASVMESLNTRLSMLYITDPLTGLYNRFGLEQKGRLLYDQILKKNQSVYICFIDIDDLKKINDMYGHECGDDAIVRISQVIMKGIKDPSMFAMRYGGDEFVVIGERSVKDSIDQAMEAEQLEEAHYPYVLSASVGEFEVHKEDGLTLQQAIEHADDTMYEIKKKKKLNLSNK